MGKTLKAEQLKPYVQAEAMRLGFDVCRFTAADLNRIHGQQLEQAVDKNYHGSMGWLKSTLDRRKSPAAMWPEARSVIILGMNYGPKSDPLENLKRPDRATISVYARNRDYHDVIKGKLKTLAGKVASRTGKDVKVFVDTAPLMEKPLAAQAGVGWQGKHTNLVSREFGSWLFLGTILTVAELEPDDAEADHCGSCRSCLDVCPTNAFPAPYQLDARKCISYLTIEHDGPIDRSLRSKMGNHIYGCDDCLAVCPWNKFARASAEIKLAEREDLKSPELRSLLTLDDAGFRKKFSGSPIKRIGRNRFIRNILIAAGNSGDAKLAHSITPHFRDEDASVRGASVWAFARLVELSVFEEHKTQALRYESDQSVLVEWELGKS